jgi:hypothetical protein
MTTTDASTPTRDIDPRSINLDLGIRVRAADDEDAVKDFAAAYARNDQLPWPHLFETPSGLMVADGRHRLRAAMMAEIPRLRCYVHKGTELDCLGWALASNHKHGVRRTNADKRLGVELALRHFPAWSDGRIAQWVGVSQPYVGTVRMILTNTHRIPKAPIRLGNDGKLQPSDKGLQSGHNRYDPTGVPAQPDSSSNSNTLPARQDPTQPVQFSQPVPAPITRDEITEHIGRALRFLDRFCKEHPLWKDPALERAIVEVKRVAASLQMELPGMPEPVKPRARGTQQEVVEYCCSLALTAEDGNWFFDKNQGCGWRINGRAIQDYRAVVRAWKHQDIFPSQKAALRASGGKPAQESLAMKSIKAHAAAIERKYGK